MSKRTSPTSIPPATTYLLAYILAPAAGGLLAGLFHGGVVERAHARAEAACFHQQDKRQRVRHINARGKSEEVNSNVAISISIGHMHDRQTFEDVDEDAEHPMGVQFYVIDPEKRKRVQAIKDSLPPFIFGLEAFEDYDLGENV